MINIEILKMIWKYAEFPVVNIILPIVISVIVFWIQIRHGNKSNIPILHIMYFKGIGKRLNANEVKKYEALIMFYYLRHDSVDGNLPNRKEIKFKRTTYHHLMDDLAELNFLVLSFEGGTEQGLVLHQIFDKPYEVYDMDEEIVPLSIMAGRKYCFVCAENDKPFSIKGDYMGQSVSYEIKSEVNAYIKPKLRNHKNE